MNWWTIGTGPALTLPSPEHVTAATPGTSRRLEGEVGAVAAEVRAVVRVAGPQELAPLQVEQVVLPPEPRLLLGRVLVAPRLRLQVVQLRVRRPHHPVAGLQHRQAQV